jgi:hypothetical protein
MSPEEAAVTAFLRLRLGELADEARAHPVRRQPQTEHEAAPA